MTPTDKLSELRAAATPGPWFVAGVRVKLDRQDTHAICKYDETSKRDTNIANVWYNPMTGLGHADAALIAMAPDLAAEVIRLRSAMQRIADGNVPLDRPAFVWHDKYQSLRDFARKRLEDTK